MFQSFFQILDTNDVVFCGVLIIVAFAIFVLPKLVSLLRGWKNV